jgi:hypothetical protein
MTESDVLEIIATGDNDATGLLLDAVPGAERKFKAATKKLNELLLEVQKTFPNANYYSASGALCLLLGSSHADDSNQTAQHDLVALNTITPDIGGGDW